MHLTAMLEGNSGHSATLKYKQENNVVKLFNRVINARAKCEISNNPMRLKASVV